MGRTDDSSKSKKSSASSDNHRRDRTFQLDRRKSQGSPKLRIFIVRPELESTGRESPFRRDIGDPKLICQCVHETNTGSKAPLFGPNIKVNRSSDNSVSRSRSRSRRRQFRNSSKGRSKNYRSASRDSSKSLSRSRSRSRSKRLQRSRSRYRSSRSRERRRSKSAERSRRRSASPSKRSKSRRDSRSRSRHKEKHYDCCNKRHKRSRTRSRSPLKHKSDNSRRKSSSRKRRSITPLRPGEYRPGHPDLALRRREWLARKSRSRSPRKDSRNQPSTSREVHSLEKSRSGKSDSSPYSKHNMPYAMPGMEFGFYDEFGTYPYQARFPMMDYYPRMFAPGMMMRPRLPFHPMMSRMPFRPRWPVYNQGTNRIEASKVVPATVTSEEGGASVSDVQGNVDSSDGPVTVSPSRNEASKEGNNENVSSSDK